MGTDYAAGHRHAVLGHWLELPLAPASCDLVLGDGCVAAIRCLEGAPLIRAARRVLRQDGLMMVRRYSAPTRYGYAWGSHERTDSLWSSDRLLVVHDGADASRVEKLRALAGEPLVHAHLRVCWENRAPAGNCSACDKCVSTMAIAAACAEPERFVTFDWSIPIERRIARLRSTRFVLTYGDLLALPLRASLRSAIEALLRRNRLPYRLRTFWHRWRG